MSIRRSLAVGGAMALVAVPVGFGVTHTSEQTPSDPQATTARGEIVRPVPDTAEPRRTPEDGRPDHGGTPRRMVIPRLGVDATVVSRGSAGGRFVPPDDAQVLGWWADGARPGDGRGSALVAGHTLHGGGGALNNLEKLAVGDRISVATGARVVRYQVRSVVVLTKRQVAARSAQLFSQDVPGRLVVVTCEMWNGRRFVGNAVVTADPVRAAARSAL